MEGWKGGPSIAHEALDRHVAAGHGDDLALRWLGKDGTRRDLTYAGMTAGASRFANLLASHGLRTGDSVFAMTGRVRGPMPQPGPDEQGAHGGAIRSVRPTCVNLAQIRDHAFLGSRIGHGHSRDRVLRPTCTQGIEAVD